MTTLDVLLDSDLGPVHGKKGICDYCSNDEFFVLVIFGHMHLQCTSCGISFCEVHGCDHKIKPQPKKAKKIKQHGN